MRYQLTFCHSRRMKIMHKYTEIGAFLALFSFPFSEILHFLCDKTGGREGGNRHFVGGEQLSDCRQTAIRVLHGQLSVTCPTAV